jgi:hypothetical protein
VIDATVKSFVSMRPTLLKGQRTRLMFLLAFLCMPALALCAYFTAGIVLSLPAELPRHVDVVVVLGGDAGTGGRYARGRDLVLAGYSERLILIHPSVSQRKDAAAKVPSVEIVDSFLSRNSWEEAKTVRARMEAEGLRSVMVVSDPPHMLRLRYAWGSIFRGSDLAYQLIATSPPWWSEWRWWRNTESASFVRNEVLKLGYYIVHYRFAL